MSEQTPDTTADKTVNVDAFNDGMKRIEDMEKSLVEREAKLIAREDQLAERDAESQEVIKGLEKRVNNLQLDNKTEKEQDLANQHAIRNERANLITREHTYQVGSKGKPRKLKIVTAVEKDVEVK